MYRIKHAIILLVITITACICGLIYLNNTINYFKDSIVDIMDSAAKQDFKKASELSELLAMDWDEKEKILTFVVNNKELDEITFCMSQLESYVDEEYINELRAVCEKVITILDHIWDFEKPNLYKLL